MANIPHDLRYTSEHEYVRTDGDHVVIGITDYAQGELGDVVYVDLPKPGASFDKMQAFGTIEAVKAVSELYCPLDGQVVDVNTALDGDPALVNKDPYGEGWMVKLKPRNPGDVEQLLTADQYTTHIGQ